MIANLPLLFANGDPTALSKISAAELEKFITFMVTCSWGHDTAKDIRQPPWWPADVPFSHPFSRPSCVPRNWEDRLKHLVRKCYDYHKSAFLLVFSSQLARYPRARLRYVDNHDHTTSLYYRPNGRLLVTFRNENLYYDKPASLKEAEPQLKSTDIYLCDNCDSHFDNIDILRAHERLCNAQEVPVSTTCTGGLPEFLSALKLLPVDQPYVDTTPKPKDVENKSRNPRSSSNIDRGPPYPFSSLAYMRNAKPNANRDLSYSRERVERYCCDTSQISKNLANKSKNQQFPIRYRRPIDYWNRRYVFPNQRNKRVLSLTAQLLLLKCRRVSVDVERMSQHKVEVFLEELNRKRVSRRADSDDVIVVETAAGMDPTAESVSVARTKPKVETVPAAGKKPAAGTKPAVGPEPVAGCEVIDLCSDDEGGACVMRGGAVLRRRPPPPTTYHPPLILITHTLPNVANLQTISID